MTLKSYNYEWKNLSFGIEVGTNFFLKTFGFSDNDINNHGTEMAEALVGESYDANSN